MKAKVTYTRVVLAEPVEIEVSPETVKYINWVENHIRDTRPSDVECLIAIDEIKAQVRGVRGIDEFPLDVAIDISKVEVLP